MATEPIQEGTSTNEAEVLSPEELANSWLNFREAEARQRIQGVQQRLDFVHGYNPQPPGLRPLYIEPGSTDASDWEVAELEHDQWPVEQEEAIERANIDLDSLYDDLARVQDFRSKIVEGDHELVVRFAAAEKKRRFDLAIQQKRAKDQKKAREEGVEFEGAAEVISKLNELTGAINSGQIPEGAGDPQGWRFSRHFPEERRNLGGLPSTNPEQFLFSFRDRQGLKGTSQVFMRVVKPTEDSYELTIDDLQNPIEGQKYEGGPKVPTGVNYSLRLQSTRAFEPHVGGATVNNTYGYAETEHGQGTPGNRFFEQEHFNRVKGLVKDLSSSMKSVTTK